MVKHMKKFIYKFRVHNKDEEKKVLKLISKRKFGISYSYGEWTEYNTLNEFMCNHPDTNDYIVRLYFNNEHNRNKTRKEVRRLIGTHSCGNDNCNKYQTCIYSPYNCKEDVEYLWRCILADENCRFIGDDD